MNSGHGVGEKEKTSGQNGNGPELSPLPERFAGPDQISELEFCAKGKGSIVAVNAVRKKVAQHLIVRRWLFMRDELVVAAFSPEEGNIRVVVAKGDRY
jgi:hypothetical protein